MNTRFLLLLAALAAAVAAEKVNFRNYRVYRVIPESDGQLAMLRQLEEAMPGLDFWKGPSNVKEPVDVMVAPHQQPSFLEAAQSLQLTPELFIEDVQRNIDEETVSTYRASGFGWTDYYRLADINAWLKELASKHPEVEVVVGGKSYEGRDITGVKVTFNPSNPAVFFEAGIHAREWISPATVTYILNQILTNNSIADTVKQYNYYFFPSVNPDGYEYTHTTSRLWRKTRSPSNVLCYGADPNRNWGFHWMDGGASNNPCSDTYAGSSPFSEIETRSLSQFITSISKELKVYLAFHSYSQLLLIPYGHSNEHIQGYDQLLNIGNEAANALKKVYGTSYKVGNIVDTIYVASGGSMDWVRGTYGTPVTYTWELRDQGRYGFTLPANQILPNAIETLESVLVILKRSKELI